MRISRLLLVAVLAIGELAAAQAATDSAKHGADSVPGRAPWHLGIFVGVAHNSPANQLLGVTPGRDHLFLGLSASTAIIRSGTLEVRYAVQFLPLVVIHGNAAPVGYGDTLIIGTTSLDPSVIAIGLSPFGFQIAERWSDHLSFFLGSAAGALWFERDYPVEGAGRISFTLELGLGMDIKLAHARVLELGYKYHHLSNAYFHELNPGVDAHVFYAGYQWTVTMPR